MDMIIPMLAAIELNQVVSAIFYLIVVGLVIWLLFWLIGYVGLPEPFSKVAKVILAVLAVFLLINFLLGLTGEPIVRWHKP